MKKNADFLEEKVTERQFLTTLFRGLIPVVLAESPEKIRRGLLRIRAAVDNYLKLL